jgi:hypothetical protein
MRRPRYRLTDADLGREFLVVARGVSATVLGDKDQRDGRYEVAYSDGTLVRLWPSAIAARIDDGRWERADRTRTCVRCGRPKPRDQQECISCRRVHQ